MGCSIPLFTIHRIILNFIELVFRKIYMTAIEHAEHMHRGVRNNKLVEFEIPRSFSVIRQR